MEQLDYLWRYQEIEQMLDRYNAERKKIPILARLNKLKKDILDKQEAISQMGKTVKDKNESYKQIREKYEDVAKNLHSDKDKFAKDGIADDRELTEFQNKIKSYASEVEAARSALQTLKTDIERLDEELVKVRNELKTLSNEYNELKKQYEEQIKSIGISVDEIKKEKQELKARLDKNLLDKYQALKKHKHTAVALLDGDKCSGCNMSLPSVVLTAVKEGKRIIECENCGRILYYK